MRSFFAPGQFREASSELTPGQAKKDLTTGQAKAILASVRPRDLAGKNRRRLAAEQLADHAGIAGRRHGCSHRLAEASPHRHRSHRRVVDTRAGRAGAAAPVPDGMAAHGRRAGRTVAGGLCRGVRRPPATRRAAPSAGADVRAGALTWPTPTTPGGRST